MGQPPVVDHDYIRGLGSRSDFVHAVPEADGRPLPPEERTVVQLAGAGMTIADVVAKANLPEARAIATLLGLRLRGLIMPGRRKGSGPSSFPTSAPAPVAKRVEPADPDSAQPPRDRDAPAAKPVEAAGSGLADLPLDSEALGEKTDLDPERKAEILRLEALSAGENLFALLGLDAGAEPAEVKKAYYELSRRIHPDRFFGKSLGSFKERIDRVFRRLTEAQATLSDSTKRAAWLVEHPSFAPRPVVRAPVDEKRAAERRTRLSRHPYLAKQAKLHELINRGKELFDKKEFSRAYADLHLALQIDPENKELAKLAEQALKGGDKERAAKAFDEGKRAEGMGDYTQALAQYRSAATLDPSLGKYPGRAAKVLLERGGTDETALRDARSLALAAVEAEPRNPEHHLIYAMVLTRSDQKKNAVKEYERVLELRPDDEFAKEQLKKLKFWPF